MVLSLFVSLPNRSAAEGLVCHMALGVSGVVSVELQKAVDTVWPTSAPNGLIARLGRCPWRFPYPHTSADRFSRSRRTPGGHEWIL